MKSIATIKVTLEQPDLVLQGVHLIQETLGITVSVVDFKGISIIRNDDDGTVKTEMEFEIRNTVE